MTKFREHLMEKLESAATERAFTVIYSCLDYVGFFLLQSRQGQFQKGKDVQMASSKGCPNISDVTK